FVTVLLTAAVVGLVCLVFLATNRARLDRLQALASQMAKGDLSARVQVDGDDATGRVGAALAALLARTSAMVTQLQHTSEALGRAASEMALSSSQQAATATKQAAAVAETGTTVSELRDTFK